MNKDETPDPGECEKMERQDMIVSRIFIGEDESLLVARISIIYDRGWVSQDSANRALERAEEQLSVDIKDELNRVIRGAYS